MLSCVFFKDEDSEHQLLKPYIFVSGESNFLGFEPTPSFLLSHRHSKIRVDRDARSPCAGSWEGLLAAPGAQSSLSCLPVLDPLHHD